MLVQVRQCKMQTCTMHMHNATTKPRKQKEANKIYKDKPIAKQMKHSANTTAQIQTGLDQMDPTEYHGKGNNQKTTSPS